MATTPRVRSCRSAGRKSDSTGRVLCRLRRCQFKKSAGCSAPCAPGSLSFVRPKERGERKGRPDGALSCAPRLWDPGPAHETSLSRVPVAHLSVHDPFGARALSHAVLGCAIRGFENISAYQYELGCSTPRSARRVPPSHREQLSETVFEPEARFLCPASWSSARWGEDTKGVFARFGADFFW